jgi:hypothetical protein
MLNIANIFSFQIANLNDFFGEDSIFVAYGCEKHAVDDFALDDNGKQTF